MSVPTDPAPKPQHAAQIAAPTGTRDLYPIELARRRFIEDKWRKVAIRHGFDEIDGPTFESAQLYAVKSGDGILSELFQTFSGKDEERIKKMGAALAAGTKGDGRAWNADAMAPFALRPEFTPTLARMYAARAKQLPQPTKWFWQGPCFRAERPQRGRLREFWQWNCDIIGAPPSAAPTGPTAASASGSPVREHGGTNASASASTSPASTSPTRERGGNDTAQLDAEIIAVCVELLASLGLANQGVNIHISHRAALEQALTMAGCAHERLEQGFALVDRWSTLKAADARQQAVQLGLNPERLVQLVFQLDQHAEWSQRQDPAVLDEVYERGDAGHLAQDLMDFASEFGATHSGFEAVVDMGLARGLAYYTGMVFEVIVDGERAVAGGGRYDNLIELFGGPPTPAVGFGMGDVVLSLVLQDKGLMPSDREIAAELGLRPDIFIISNGTPESDAAVAPLLAALRRAGLHARRSYKATRNLGKLLKEASDSAARFAAIIENPSEATVKDLDENRQWDPRVPLTELASKIPAPKR